LAKKANFIPLKPYKGNIMSTSTLYHGWGIKGYTLKSTEYDKNRIVYNIIPQTRLYICPDCNSSNVTTRGSIKRKIKTLPIGFKKECYVSVLIPRLYCHKCNSLKFMRLNFAEAKKSYTNHLSSLVILMSNVTTILDISIYLNMHCVTVKGIVKNHLIKKFDKPDLRKVTMISIDEISAGKGHNYVTVVIDAKTGQPLHVGKGKGESALEDFWTLLGPRRRKKIEAVAIDMGNAYISAVTKNLPNAKIVFDRFHVVKLVNETLNKLRIDVLHAASQEDRRVLAGTKYILLRNEADLDDKKRERLGELLALNTPLSIGYILKEDLRQFWEKSNINEAINSLKSWLDTARKSGENLLIKLAKTIESHAYGLYNWYDYKINSGRIEGINTKINVMKRKTFGLRDFSFFRLLILAIKRSRELIAFRLGKT
jgi:transposase